MKKISTEYAFEYGTDQASLLVKYINRHLKHKGYRLESAGSLNALLIYERENVNPIGIIFGNEKMRLETHQDNGRLEKIIDKYISRTNLKNSNK